MKSKNKNIKASIIASSMSGVLEIGFFHPLDTVAKRLMNNKTNVNFSNVKKIVLQKHYNSNFMKKFSSLYPGLGFATSYKISQRVYKYSGQHILKNYFLNNHINSFNTMFGDKYSKVMVSAISGSLIGIGEIALLPLDILKIKSQINPEFLSNRGILELIKKEKFNLYSGWRWTILRNAPGSFTLFGASTFFKSKIFGLDISDNASLFQHFITSSLSSTACILVSSPMDVIKTRIQAQDFGKSESGIKIVKDMLKHEGPGGFFKGIIPKISSIGPKLTFSFTVAQYLIQYFEGLKFLS
jgi:hypothetical protein